MRIYNVNILVLVTTKQNNPHTGFIEEVSVHKTIEKKVVAETKLQADQAVSKWVYSIDEIEEWMINSITEVKFLSPTVL